MSQRFTYDYYRILVEVDVASAERRLDIAMEDARDNALIYASPCEWRAGFDPKDHNYVIVRRKRARRMNEQLDASRDGVGEPDPVQPSAG